MRDLEPYARWEPAGHDRQAAGLIRAERGDAAADAYLAAVRPGFAVITAGYADPAEALGTGLPGTVPHWSGVFFHPFAKGEIVVLVGGAGGREPEDAAHPCQRRPAKWPVKVEWFGADLDAARVRSFDVTCARAVALLDTARPDGPVRAVPVVMASCAWCGITANRASMERINAGRSVACRDVGECQRRCTGAG